MSETSNPRPEADSIERQIAERNDRLQSLLDPQHELPEVSLTDITDPSTDLEATAQYNLIHAIDGRTIGYLRVGLPSARRIALGHATARVGLIELDKEARGKGYGRAVYLELLKSLPLDVELESDRLLTRGTYLIWRWMENAGVAVHCGQKESLIPDNKGYYQHPQFVTKICTLHR